jgi:hypothetical protein
MRMITAFSLPRRHAAAGGIRLVLRRRARVRETWDAPDSLFHLFGSYEAGAFEMASATRVAGTPEKVAVVEEAAGIASMPAVLDARGRSA